RVGDLAERGARSRSGALAVFACGLLIGQPSPVAMSRRWFILSAIGTDRPGLVADLAQLIYDCDANLEDSRMTILGSDFALLLRPVGGRRAPGGRRQAVGARPRSHVPAALARGGPSPLHPRAGNAALPPGGSGPGPRRDRRRPLPRPRRPRRQHRRAHDPEP